MPTLTTGFGRGFNFNYNGDDYKSPTPQLYVDGYAVPWISGVSVSDARLKLKNPINSDGTITLYASILNFFTLASFWTKKDIMTRLGYKPRKHARFGFDKSLSMWFKYKKPGYHYPFGSYFTALGHCGLIQWNPVEKVWTPGPRLDDWKREVLYPALQEKNMTPDQYWDAFDAKLAEGAAKNS